MVIGGQAGTFRYLENENGVYTELLGVNNPFEGLTVGFVSAPIFADVDNDGDVDLVAGEYYGNLKYYTNTNATFTEQTGLDNPFNGYDIGIFPKFADVDGDNDDDLVVGDVTAGIKFSEKEASGDYIEKTGTDNPFGAVQSLRESTPDFGDFDGDGDLDLIFNAIYTGISYSTNENGVFSDQSGNDNNPFGASTDVHPAFIDVDGDGDLDLVSGDRDGVMAYWKNNNGVMTQALVAADNPFSSIAVSTGRMGNNAPRPTAVDLDGDGHEDLVFTKPEGTVGYMQNDDYVFTEQTGTANPFNDINTDLLVSTIANFAVTFSDLDGDGDLDMLMSNRGGIHLEFRNTSPVVSAIHSSQEQEILSIYPNPATSTIYVVEGEIQIFDQIGSLVLHTYSTGKIDISSLKAGNYFVSQEGKKAKLIVE